MVTQKQPVFLAFDLGASNGCALLGRLTGDKLEFNEIDRFTTEMVHVGNNWHWNIYRFFEKIKKGIEKSFTQANWQPTSLAVNTWGVDFGLLSAEGELLGLPFAYRDSRTDGVMEKVFQLIDRNELYELTGIQFMQINSLFQLYAMKMQNHSFYQTAQDCLFMPDIINYFLTGKKFTEFSFATCSQMYNPNKKCWDETIFQKLDIPIDLMQTVIEPGTEIGALSKTIAHDTATEKLKVFSVVSHDTGSAVAAVPARGDDWAYVSSGTWSLLGVETKSPIITAKSQELNFTNEGGYNSTFRVQKT